MANGIILDTNCFSHVFNCSDKRHSEFKPIFDWLILKTGYLVYGGTKYRQELSASVKYLKIFKLLHRYNKAITYSDAAVDLEMHRIIELTNDTGFNDPHLAAIVIITKCKVICTGDTACIPFLKKKLLYEGKVEPPKFYVNQRSIKVLTRENVGSVSFFNKRSSKELVAAIHTIN